MLMPLCISSVTSRGDLIVMFMFFVRLESEIQVTGSARSFSVAGGRRDAMRAGERCQVSHYS
jgi:hypothetical protein